MPFFSIEGIDGSGKSTQVERLVLRLRASGKQALRTKEPDGGYLGPEIRAIMVQDRVVRLSPVEELLLVSAARVDHVRSVISPALRAGHWIVSDRFADSSFALQVIGGGVGENVYRAIAEEIIGECMPDVTFILDLPEEVAVTRRRGRNASGTGADPAEAGRDFRRVRQGFLEAARREPNRCRVIDATSAADEVHEAIWSEVARLL